MRCLRVVVTRIVAVTMVAVGGVSCGGEVAEGPVLQGRADTMKVVYGDHVDNYGILHLPEGEGPYPVVVMVHGGGWLEDHDLGYFEPLAASLAESGVAVWNIEYRRVTGEGGWPATLADADDATESLATVVQQAAGGRLDLGRVHLAGHSAGGHLAAWIAGRHTLGAGAPGARPRIRPRSATIMAGVFDLALAVRKGHDEFVEGLLDGAPAEQPARYAVGSPIRHLPVGIPVVAVHGSADTVVDPVQSRNYVRAAQAAGDPARLGLLEGVGHADFGDIDSTAWASARAIILEHVTGAHAHR
ncbi:alpha/beta fold hydrolase [Nocardia sp. NPDC019395]|uniref:alpha/beta hydrolase family protein n=1 Tax=Nocardia sp. NPDC019395 TaxID=3154686 RepID=UPI0033C09D1B